MHLPIVASMFFYGINEFTLAENKMIRIVFDSGELIPSRNERGDWLLSRLQFGDLLVYFAFLC